LISVDLVLFLGVFWFSTMADLLDLFPVGNYAYEAGRQTQRGHGAVQGRCYVRLRRDL